MQNRRGGRTRGVASPDLAPLETPGPQDVAPQPRASPLRPPGPTPGQALEPPPLTHSPHAPPRRGRPPPSERPPPRPSRPSRCGMGSTRRRRGPRNGACALRALATAQAERYQLGVQVSLETELGLGGGRDTTTRGGLWRSRDAVEGKGQKERQEQRQRQPEVRRSHAGVLSSWAYPPGTRVWGPPNEGVGCHPPAGTPGPSCTLLDPPRSTSLSP